MSGTGGSWITAAPEPQGAESPSGCTAAGDAQSPSARLLAERDA